MEVKQILYARVFRGVDQKTLILRMYNGIRFEKQCITTNPKEILSEIEKTLNNNVNENQNRSQGGKP